MNQNNKLQVFKTELDKRAETLYKNILPDHIKPEQFARHAFAYIAQNPKLLECSKDSLFASLCSLAQLGLCPESFLGQAYIVPFGKTAQALIGYKGYITLARNSGQVINLSARAVYEGDKFDYAYGLNEKLEHVPCPPDQRGSLTHAYAVATFVNGGHTFVVLPREEIAKRMEISSGYQAYKKGYIKTNPWVSDFEAMATKTAVRELSKYLPLKVQIADALETAIERGQHAHLDDDMTITVEPEEEEPFAPVTNDEIYSAAEKIEEEVREKEAEPAGEPIDVKFERFFAKIQPQVQEAINHQFKDHGEYLEFCWRVMKSFEVDQKTFDRLNKSPEHFINEWSKLHAKVNG